MTLVDTSSFIEAIRPKGNLEVKRRVGYLLEKGLACWCEPVRLELWNHRGEERQRILLTDFNLKLSKYPVTDRVWSYSVDLAVQARKSGLTVPAIDLIIFSCAKVHELEIESTDEHFEMLAKL